MRLWVILLVLIQAPVCWHGSSAFADGDGSDSREDGAPSVDLQQVFALVEALQQETISLRMHVNYLSGSVDHLRRRLGGGRGGLPTNGCFLAGSQVVCGLEGETRSIEEIQVGDQVLTGYLDSDGSFREGRLQPVTKVHQRRVSRLDRWTHLRIELSNGSVLEVTSNHLIISGGELIPAYMLAPESDESRKSILTGPNGEEVTVVSVERVNDDEDVEVFNITVEGPHNYFCEGVLVSNKS